LVDICGYELPTNLQKFHTKKDLTKVKTFQNLGGGLLFFKHPAHVYWNTAWCNLFSIPRLCHIQLAYGQQQRVFFTMCAMQIDYSISIYEIDSI